MTVLRFGRKENLYAAVGIYCTVPEYSAMRGPVRAMLNKIVREKASHNINLPKPVYMNMAWNPVAEVFLVDRLATPVLRALMAGHTEETLLNDLRGLVSGLGHAVLEARIENPWVEHNTTYDTLQFGYAVRHDALTKTAISVNAYVQDRTGIQLENAPDTFPVIFGSTGGGIYKTFFVDVLKDYGAETIPLADLTAQPLPNVVTKSRVHWDN